MIADVPLIDFPMHNLDDILLFRLVLLVTSVTPCLHTCPTLVIDDTTLVELHTS
jgi:hypothetical protein